MLDIRQIESFYPENQRIFKRNILREYLQYKILEIIFGSKYAVGLTFIGGTALRIIFQHSRFSEDLDFDVTGGMDKSEFMQMSELIKTKLALEGYNIEVKNTFKGAYRSYFGFKDILFSYGISGHKNEKLTIQVDAESQGVPYDIEKPIINKFDVFIRINTAPAGILLSQKIYAILKRKRPMGRDFYDTVFLFGRNKPDFSYLQIKTDISSIEELKTALLNKCEGLNLKELTGDVKPYLLNPLEEKKILLFPDYIRSLR